MVNITKTKYEGTRVGTKTMRRAGDGQFRNLR
jgi:hypothetical protein